MIFLFYLSHAFCLPVSLSCAIFISSRRWYSTYSANSGSRAPPSGAVCAQRALLNSIPFPLVPTCLVLSIYLSICLSVCLSESSRVESSVNFKRTRSLTIFSFGCVANPWARSYWRPGVDWMSEWLDGSLLGFLIPFFFFFQHPCFISVMQSV